MFFFLVLVLNRSRFNPDPGPPTIAVDESLRAVATHVLEGDVSEPDVQAWFDQIDDDKSGEISQSELWQFAIEAVHKNTNIVSLEVTTEIHAAKPADDGVSGAGGPQRERSAL